ncbi:MAG: SufE family protein [Melioribacteraceae bacterium]|nr:SufE family protein [Melioribacteraceae bacterium]MCF8356852.1 SufE family protein [Melioribacteraceae bacterium]MCF8396231.1 SufE family protein [Melioribacteraceae bacterium]MCF8421154.1 SufE family protein [Melioribacteraceae bacterium]
MQYPEKIMEVLNTIDLLPDQNDRINYLIEIAEKFEQVPNRIAEKPYEMKNRVEYCESEAYVWVVESEEGGFDLYFAVENPHGVSAKALAVILKEGLSGKSAEEILKVDPDIVLKIFGSSLSMGKNLGLTGIVRKVHQLVKEKVSAV